ncbi:hypothetical protein Q7A53_05735 [Halobacillus rhizosphaerae]|uniref:hypothetical protein n=1 Tax=Halobacillus rhizosphaerae TaxID=3064889 RepID=UPI00398BA5B3
MISDKLRALEYHLRQNNADEEMIKLILKAEIDGITPKQIYEVVEIIEKIKTVK